MRISPEHRNDARRSLLYLLKETFGSECLPPNPIFPLKRPWCKVVSFMIKREAMAYMRFVYKTSCSIRSCGDLSIMISDQIQVHHLLVVDSIHQRMPSSPFYGSTSHSVVRKRCKGYERRQVLVAIPESLLCYSCDSGQEVRLSLSASLDLHQRNPH